MGHWDRCLVGGLELLVVFLSSRILGWGVGCWTRRCRMCLWMLVECTYSKMVQLTWNMRQGLVFQDSKTHDCLCEGWKGEGYEFKHKKKQSYCTWAIDIPPKKNQ